MTEIELPPPPNEGGPMSAEDIETLGWVKNTLEELLPAMESVNRWTDSLQGRVDPDKVPRYEREAVSVVTWQAEFIERVLKQRIPQVAIMEMLSYLKIATGGSAGIEIREISQEDAKRLGYL